MMMADRHHLRPRLVNLAVDHALGILPDAGLRERPRFQIVRDEVVGRDQFGRARTRQQIPVGVARHAHADMAEGVDHTLVGDDAVGERELAAGFGEIVGHWYFLSFGRRLAVPHYRILRPAQQRARRLTGRGWW